MKLMIASDIHGSTEWTLRLVERFKAEKPDKLILLGDILYHGPRNDLPEGYNPKKVISLLEEIKKYIICVKGNCDAEVDDMVLPFSVLSDNMLIYADGVEMFITHGHKYNPENPPVFISKGILIYGHTHIPDFTDFGDFISVNPGSISIPKENSQNSYIIYENNSFYWKNLSGDVYKERCLEC